MAVSSMKTPEDGIQFALGAFPRVYKGPSRLRQPVEKCSLDAVFFNEQ